MFVYLGFGVQRLLMRYAPITKVRNLLRVYNGKFYVEDVGKRLPFYLQVEASPRRSQTKGDKCSDATEVTNYSSIKTPAGQNVTGSNPLLPLFKSQLCTW